MDAYWAEGVDLSQRAGLESLARAVGVSDAAIAQALDDRIWARRVDDSTARAQAVGATGVPAFVIDWRVLVVGAQPRELLAQAVEQARHEPSSHRVARGEPMGTVLHLPDVPRRRRTRGAGRRSTARSA